MKLTQEHVAHMTAAIAKIPEYKVAAHRQFIVNEGKSKDVEKRLRWDLSYYAGLTPWICEHVYSYANDDHVDTALRAIMRELY
ncbi:hypothetical protein ACWX0O_01680 [Nitrobacteraceae bacterium UC4449_H16]